MRPEWRATIAAVPSETALTESSNFAVVASLLKQPMSWSFLYSSRAAVYGLPGASKVVFFLRIWLAQSSDFWAEPMYMSPPKICVGQTEPPLSQIGATEGAF